MMEWLMGGAAKALLGAFGDTFVTPFLNVWAKKMDVDVQKLQTLTDEEKAEKLALIGYGTARLGAQKDVLMAMLGHPIWWVAWSLFVFPVGFYHAAIFIVSTLDAPFIIKRVPEVQEQWAQMIVLSFFGLFVGTGIVGAVLSKFGKK
jgi:hypothetical protein